ncbi:MAG: hypothetical protein QOF89_3901 [Acidobacteriota bacterium]|jgi:hypothetical protein|nr:hypothetical protein [Acidobacteriota bacterium]
MLQDLTPTSFEAHLGSPFHIHYGGAAPLEVVLQGVRCHEAHPGPRAQPFSVYFRSPNRGVLPQAIYRMEHPVMGMLELFLVPIGSDPKEGGMVYEAVFN